MMAAAIKATQPLLAGRESRAKPLFWRDSGRQLAFLMLDALRNSEKARSVASDT